MKIVTTKYYCDTCERELKGSVNTLETQVVFHTEQTEGRATKPYKTLKQLHLCDYCYERSLYETIHGKGAQGVNQYYFGKKEC